MFVGHSLQTTMSEDHRGAGVVQWHPRLNLHNLSVQPWIFAIFTFFTFFTFFTCSHFLHYVDLQSRLVRMKIGGVNLSIFCPLFWKNPPMEPACCDDFEFREKFDTLRVARTKGAVCHPGRHGIRW